MEYAFIISEFQMLISSKSTQVAANEYDDNPMILVNVIYKQSSNIYTSTAWMYSSQ